MIKGMNQYTKIRINVNHFLRDDNQHNRNICGVIECNRSTKDRKPYCVDHITRQPYVSGLLKQIKQRDKDEAAILRRGKKAVKLESSISQEILSYLYVQGPRSAAKLSHELNLDKKLIGSVVEFMCEHGLMISERNGHGRLVVYLESETIAWFDEFTKHVK